MNLLLPGVLGQLRMVDVLLKSSAVPPEQLWVPPVGWGGLGGLERTLRFCLRASSACPAGTEELHAPKWESKGLGIVL